MEKQKGTKTRRSPKRLSHTLYAYVEPQHGQYARTYGKKNFGSFSSYVDALIARDKKEHGGKRPQTKQD